MSALFERPIRVNVLPGEDGLLEVVAITEHGVPRKTTSTTEDLPLTLAELTTNIAQIGSRSRGVVVFNAAPDVMPALSYFVADEAQMWEADEELEADDENHWKAAHKEWAKEHRPSRTRRRATVPAVEPTEDWDPEAVSRLKPAVVPQVPRGKTVTFESEDLMHETHRAGAAVVTPQVAAGDTLVRREDTPEDEEAIQRRMDAARNRARQKAEADLAARQKAEAEARTPSTVSELPSLMARGKHDQSAEDGIRGALNGLGFHLPPGTAEDFRRKRMASILRGWDGTRYVTVANEKGSTGKTPVSMMTASALSRFGRGSVILRDGNPTGNADERGEFTPPLGKHPDGRPYNDLDLALHYATHGALDDATMARFLHYHTSDGYGLLSHFDSEDEDDEMRNEEVEASYKAIAPHASAVVTDTSNTPFDRRDRIVLERTHQLVVPFLTLPDRENGARKTCTRLERRSEHTHDLVRNGIAVILTASPGRAHRATAKEYAARWQEVVRHVVVVPYDQHMHSTSLRFGDLKDPTKSAILDLGAAVADGFRAA